MSEQTTTDLRETVRQRYAAAAVKAAEGNAACSGPEPVEADENFGATLYSADGRDALPAEAVAASLGCGNPTAVAELREGERVLTSDRAEASTSSSLPAASGRPARRTDWT